MSCFTTGRPGKEQGTRRVQERSKGDTSCLTTSQNPSLWHPSWLNKACTTRKDSESEWLAKDNPETNSITIKLWAMCNVPWKFVSWSQPKWAFGDHGSEDLVRNPASKWGSGASSPLSWWLTALETGEETSPSLQEAGQRGEWGLAGNVPPSLLMTRLWSC